MSKTIKSVCVYGIGGVGGYFGGRVAKEVVLIGKTKNTDFRQDVVEKTLQKAKDFPYETKTSFQRDYEKRNTKNEGDIFGGTLIRLAKEYNISIPTITDVYGELTAR